MDLSHRLPVAVEEPIQTVVQQDTTDIEIPGGDTIDDQVPSVLDDSDDTGDHVPSVPAMPQESHVVLPRRSTRVRKATTLYPQDQYVLLTDGGEPESFQEAMESEQSVSGQVQCRMR